MEPSYYPYENLESHFSYFKKGKTIKWATIQRRLIELLFSPFFSFFPTNSQFDWNVVWSSSFIITRKKIHMNSNRSSDVAQRIFVSLALFCHPNRKVWRKIIPLNHCLGIITSMAHRTELGGIWRRRHCYNKNVNSPIQMNVNKGQNFTRQTADFSLCRVKTNEMLN